VPWSVRVYLAVLLSLIGVYPASAEVMVRGTQGGLTVHADDVAVRDVLDAISRQTGVPIHGARHLSEPISLGLTETGLLDVMSRILSGISYFAIHEAAPDGTLRITEIVVLAPEGRAGAAHETAPDIGVHSAEVLERALGETGLGREALLRAAVHGEDPRLQADALTVLGHLNTREGYLAVLDSATATSRDERIAALRTLATVEATEALPLLAAALQETDFALKSGALELIATLPGDGALRLLERSLSDPDPSVRLATVELVGRRTDVDSVALLQKAVRDENGAISATAEGFLRGRREGMDER